MAERRPPIQGLKPAPEVAPDLEEQFVYGKKAQPDRRTGQPDTSKLNDPTPAPPATAPAEPKNRPLPTQGRVPLTTRLRQDIAAALKRASLERQLAGVQPNSLQDILEEALEPWLKGNGYLP